MIDGIGNGETSVSRRRFLGWSAAGLLGTLLTESRAITEDVKPACARSAILVWLDGGPSQLETFDPKPYAPSGIRGEFGAIKSNAAGIHISELMPHMAWQMDKCSLIRTLTHNAHSHERACNLMLTGRIPDSSGVAPSIGSIVSAASKVRTMPAYVSIPGDTFAFGYGRAGTLGVQHNPASLDIELSAQDLNCHTNLKGIIQNRHEHSALREQFGDHPIGRECLAALRLVEAGIRFVTVSHGGWDTHGDVAAAARGWLVPQLDRALSALIENLYQCGLLDQTLVVCMGEFGRSPRINALGGRDHWPNAAFALFAGAGVPCGQVIGATDANGFEAIERPVTPREVAATILDKLGIRNEHRLAIGESVRELM